MSAHPRADHSWMDKIHRRERFADFAYTLARINWDFFTTHTFKNPLPRESVRKWLDEATKTIGQYWRRKNAQRRGLIAEKLS